MTTGCVATDRSQVDWSLLEGAQVVPMIARGGPLDGRELGLISQHGQMVIMPDEKHSSQVHLADGGVAEVVYTRDVVVVDTPGERPYWRYLPCAFSLEEGKWVRPMDEWGWQQLDELIKGRPPGKPRKGAR